MGTERRPDAGHRHLTALRSVLHVNTERAWRGGENQLRLLLTHPDAADWQWHLAAEPESEVGRRLSGNATTLAVPMRGARALTAAHTIAGYMREHELRIIDCQTSRAHNIGLLVRRLHPDVRVVVHRRVHFAPADSWLSRRKYRSDLVDRYICISRAIADVLARYGVPAERIVVVHSAVDPAQFVAVNRGDARQRLVAEFGLHPSTPVIGNLAYMTHEKGHETLLRALGVLRGRERPFFCFVAGAGPLEPSLRALAAELGLDDWCLRFLGVRDDAPALLAASDVFALSSNDEGLGTSLLDATHAGCALVATSVGGIPEVIEHERTGLLVPRGDAAGFAAALERVLQDARLRARLTTAARAHLESNFSWDSMVAGNLAVYEELLSTTPESPR